MAITPVEIPDDEASEEQQHIWKRQKGETQVWYLRFQAYLRSGHGRSMLRVFNLERAEKGLKEAVSLSGHWRKMAVRHNWRERANAFDVWRNEVEQRKYERLRKAYRQREIEIAEGLINKATQMLNFPLVVSEQTTESDGGRTIVHTTIHPARWNMRDAAAIMGMADKLYRLALVMETEHTTEEVIVAEAGNIELIRQKRWEQIRNELGIVLDDDDNDDYDSTYIGIGVEQDDVRENDEQTDTIEEQQ